MGLGLRSFTVRNKGVSLRDFNMTTAELPCYTLINVLSDSEALSEQKLAEDLGKL